MLFFHLKGKNHISSHSEIEEKCCFYDSSTVQVWRNVRLAIDLPALLIVPAEVRSPLVLQLILSEAVIDANSEIDKQYDKYLIMMATITKVILYATVSGPDVLIVHI